MLRSLSFPFLPAVILLAVAGSARAQTTFNVPSPQYPSIQSAINAAADNGDTIAVAPGTYYENLDFLAKTIIVTGPPVSAGSMPTAILDAQFKGPAAIFDASGLSLFDFSTLSNFLIEHGGSFATYDPAFVAARGALAVESASPNILNDTIVDSACFGIEVDGGSPVIQGNDISGTEGGSCYSNGGAAIYITYVAGAAPAYVIGNTLHDNIESGLDVADTINLGGGAGISVAGNSVIRNNIIYNNSSNGSAGGGISVLDADGLTIVQNLIYGNSGCGGGGIALPPSRIGAGIVALIANNTIVDNTSNPTGATGCTPSAQLYESAADAEADGPEVVIVNNILSGSTTDAAVDCAQVDPPSEASQPIFDHNILHNAGGNFFGQYCVDVSSKYGNLTADPGFTGQAPDPYSLSMGSPAIDAGNNSALALFQGLSSEQLSTDINSNPRIQDAIIDIGAYEFAGTTGGPPPTTIVLTTSAYTGHPGTNYVLTATLAYGQSTPSGTVTFFLDGAQIGTSPINGSTATLSGFNMPPGVHAIYAYYPGQGSASPAVSVINIVDITLISTTVTFQVNPNQSFFGESILFTVTSSSVDGTVPSPITLTDTTYSTLLATLTPNSDGMATYSTSTLALGPHEIKAEFAGDLTHAEASETREVTVNGYPTTTTLNCGLYSTVPLGSTIPLTATVTSTYGVPTGFVNFAKGKTALGGQVTLTNGTAGTNATATAGYNTFLVSFPAQGAFGASSGTCSVYVQSLTLTSSANPTPAYTPITFVASNAATPAPAGAYSLTIGSNPPVAMTVNGGTATYTTPGLAQGAYNVTVTFTPADGSAVYTASLLQKITAPTGDFTLTGPPTLTTPTERTTTGTVTLTSIDNFSGTVALTCNLPLPTTYTCTISPASTSLAVNGVATAIVTLAPNNLRAATGDSSGITSRIVLAALLPLTLLSLGFRRRRHKRLSALLSIALMTMVTTALTACGPDIFYTTTQPGAYPLTITGTGTTKGGATPSTHTLNITLNLIP